MKLLSLEIVGFGALENERYDLSEGLNVLCRQNGWGKSTLAVFIKAMLYGLPPTRKSSLDENERKKYRPWNGGKYGGSLSFTSARGSFRVERFFGSKEAEDSFLLIDLSTNKPTSVYRDAPLGEELFGIDEEGFERSVYLSQRQLTPKKENSSIHARLSDALENVEDLGDYDGAMELLEKRRRFYLLKGDRGAISDTESSLGETRRQLERNRGSADALIERRREAAQNREEAERRSNELEALAKQKEQIALFAAHSTLTKEKKEREERLLLLRKECAREEEFFRGRYPTDAEIREEVKRMDRLLEATWRWEAHAAPYAKEKERDALLASFRDGIPSGEELDALARYHGQLTEALARRDALRSVVGDDQDAHFAKGTPTGEEWAGAERALEEMGRMESRREEILRRGAKKKHGLRTALSGIGMLLGALAAVLGGYTLATPFGIPLLCVGGVLLLVSGILFIRTRTDHRRFLRALVSAEEKREAARGGVVRFLLAYGCSVEEPAAAMRGLKEALRIYRINRQTLERYELEIRTAEEKLRAYFARQNTAQTPVTDFRRGIDDLRRRTEELARLEREREEYLSLGRQYREAKERLAGEMHAFLSRYGLAQETSEKDALAAVIKHREQYLRLAEEIETGEAALQRFCRENPTVNATVERPVLSAEEIERRVAENKARLEELHTQSLSLRSEIRRLEEDTDALSELAARAEEEERRLEEYKKNAKIIQETAKFLTEAKEALSTRYLLGMQRSFTKALSHIPRELLPEARLNTSFEVITRSFGEDHPEASLSRGLRDAVQFCVRLALVKELFADGETPFLLLDDPFVNLDDTRLAAVKKYLEQIAKDHQILHLVCSRSRI